MERRAKELGLDRLALEIAAATNFRVAKGPFVGMQLAYQMLPVHAAHRFIGTYEQELHAVIERAISLDPPSVLNVGCAEGFYAVGLAMRLPRARIYAADADPKALVATLHNAKLNGVGNRVTAAGIVRPAIFCRYLQRRSLLIMDCEGAEFDLLDPDKAPILFETNVIVEVHSDAGSHDELRARFAKSHSVIHIKAQRRTASDAERFSNFPNVIRALDELADDRSWLYCEAL